MKAMVLQAVGTPLVEMDVPEPQPGPGQVLLEVGACAVCRTDLHVYDGDLTEPKLPLILGHEIVGRVVRAGEGVERYSEGDRVGVPWLGWTCGECQYCRTGCENLCSQAKFTGYQINGGFSELTVADERFAFPVPSRYSDTKAAPLLCAGLIGHRSLVAAGDAHRLGLYGFGAAAHIVAQVAHYEGRRLFAFTRPGDSQAQSFARHLGAEWAGSSEEQAPELLDAAIIFAPVGSLVPAALRAVAPGGTVVCAGIHMSEIPSFPYQILWMERSIHSVANLTRHDGEEFMELAPKVPVETHVEEYRLENANQALEDLRNGLLSGAAVLRVTNDESETSRKQHGNRGTSPCRRRPQSGPYRSVPVTSRTRHMKFDHESAKQILERTPSTLKALLSGLSDDWTANNEGPDTWSAHDIVAHLIHGEEADWVPRAHIILEHGESLAFEPFERFAFGKYAEGKSVNELLQRFAELRRRNLDVLQDFELTPEKLELSGTHPEFGRVTMGQLIATWAVHDLAHIAQIARVMARQWDAEVGPWKKYLSVLE